MSTINWADPVARLGLLESIGPKAYNAAMERHFEESTVEICNGHRLRRVPSRFGTLIQVDGTLSAFREINAARDVAMSLDPGKYAPVN